MMYSLEYTKENNSRPNSSTPENNLGPYNTIFRIWESIQAILIVYIINQKEMARDLLTITIYVITSR